MTDRPAPYRDVMADTFQRWADDYKVFDYVDRTVRDLDSAGYEIVPKYDHLMPAEATLLFLLGKLRVSVNPEAWLEHHGIPEEHRTVIRELLENNPT